MFRTHISPPRRLNSRRRRAGIVAAAAVLAAGVAVPQMAFAGPVSDAASFEGDDGNLARDVETNTDWNDFATVEWSGAAPYMSGVSEFDGWDFTGLTDAVVANSDTAFSGGVKQDDWCASTKGGKAPNKDDLERIYLASKTVDGDVILALAWARIPQNSTTASAHVAFEFNQGETLCAGSTLVQREAGDVLVVYDFEGGDAAPVLKLSRWLETEPADWDEAADGAWVWDDYTCEISGAGPLGEDTLGCWGNTQDLTAAGAAEAAVNTEFAVPDALPPDGSETQGLVEFGEAIINLTDAGVFGPGECLALGSVFAVSRSSGNSGQAQMKDLVGPGDLDLRNCGKITVVKETDPDNSTQSFAFTVSPAAGDPSVSSFNLTDAALVDDPASEDPEDKILSPVQVIDNVQPGSYTVTETPVPAGWEFTSVSCTGADGTPTYLDESATFDVVAESDVVCTFYNAELGSIIVEKVVAGTSVRIDGASFALDADGDPETTGDQTAIPGVTGVDGLFCVDDLDVGASYNVVETAAPSGYQAVTTMQSVVAVTGDCTTRTSGDTVVADVTFGNKKVPSLSTAPILYPNDAATLSGAYGTPSGTITFDLHAAPAEGGEACTGDILFTQTVNVSGNAEYKTTNYPGAAGITPFAITTDGLYYWGVTYSGDASNTGATSTCTAEFYDIDLEPNPATAAP